MRKLITYLALFCFISISLAADCNNPLLAAFGLTGLNQPTTVEGLRFCKSLQSGQSCCSAETVNAIQDKAKALGDRLSTIVATRDRAIVDTRDRVIPGLQQSLQKLSNNAQKAMQKMAEMAQSQNPSGVGAGASGTESFSLIAVSLQQAAQQASDNLPTIRAEFKNFQKTRVSCVVELIKLQSSAWCLACDPAYATKGVSGQEGVTLSDRVCKRLQSACFQFITGSVLQSAMLSMRSASSMIDAMATLMESLANNDLSGLASIGNLFQGAAVTDNAVIPVAMPAGCTSDTQCSWVCGNLFTARGQVDEAVLSIGGVASNPTSMFGVRLLAEEEEELVVKNKLQKRRVLQANEWNPDQDEAGVTVTFAEDPAGVGNSSSGVLRSGLMCLAGMLIALLF